MILIRENQNGTINLSGHPTLRSFPLRKVRGYLWLSGCTSLCSLQDTLAVGWSLDLTGCVSLSRLPTTLRVGGKLWLQNTAVLELPNDLEVGSHLYLQGSKVPHVSKGAKIDGQARELGVR